MRLLFLGYIVAAVKRYRDWVAESKAQPSSAPSFPCAQPSIDGGNHRIDAMKIDQAINALKDGLPANAADDLLSYYPCIILDEVGTRSDENNSYNMLTLVRNVLRLVGLPVVLMGTQARVASLIDACKISRQVGVRPWVHVVARLDPPTQGAIARWLPKDLPTALGAFLKEAMKTDRPLFSKQVSVAVENGCKDLPGIASSVGRSLHESKAELCDLNVWCKCQLMMLCNPLIEAATGECEKERDRLHGTCNDSHFAHLKDRDPGVVLLNESGGRRVLDDAVR